MRGAADKWTARAGMALAGVLVSALCANAGEVGSRVFDAADIAALDTAVESGLCKAPTEKLSEGFGEMLELRPALLRVEDGGRTWKMRLPSSKEETPIDAQRYPLEETDHAAAARVLAQPYLAAWAEFLREAEQGKSGKDDVLKLIDMAGKESAEARDVLLARLAAKYNVLYRRNPNWKEIIRDEEAFRKLRSALVSLRKVEAAKVKAAYRFRPDATPPESKLVQFRRADVTGTTDRAGQWRDFVESRAFADGSRKDTPRQAVGWEAGASGRLAPIYQSKRLSRADTYTIKLTSDQHVIVRGRLEEKQLRELRASESLSELLRKAKEYGATAFLTRPGSSKIGVPE